MIAKSAHNVEALEYAIKNKLSPDRIKLLSHGYEVAINDPNWKTWKQLYVEDMQSMFKQNQLENEGKTFEESLQFELAKEKYREAIETGKRMTPLPDHLRPITFYARVLQKEGKFEEALEKVLGVIELALENDHLNDTKEELEVLIKAREIDRDSPIKEYIERFRKKYSVGLPPISTGDIIRMTTILRLYDVMADYDSGIAYLDQYFNLVEQQGKARGDKSYDIFDRLKNSQDAISCMNRPRPNPDFNGCRFIRDYFLVREGFEQDKAEGRKSCIGAKPGEICMGRATKALIKSDYFTW